MSDFTEQKIAFAVALLAVIFTLAPMIDAAGQAGFVLLGVRLQLRHMFYAVSASLGISVYLYGIQFLTERAIRPLTRAGDILYAIALVGPAFYLMLYCGVRVAELVSSLAQSPLAGTFTSVTTSVAATLFGYYFGHRTTGRLEKLERESAVKQLDEQGVVQLHRAEQLFASGHYDLAVVESWRAVESAARRNAIARGYPWDRNWINRMLDQMSGDLRNGFDTLRKNRNMAAHNVEATSQKQAQEALAVASKLLAMLGDEKA